MRRGRVFRFMVMAFAAGAVVGLIGGLAFGGGEGKGTSGAVQDDSGIYSEVNAAPEDADRYAGEPMTAQRAELIGSNELGQVLVIVYYGVSPDAADGTTRTPDQLRDDLALLESEGFYPVNVRDLVTGDIDVPAGKSPVVITFDQSNAGQYRILDDGSLDPDCAVGIMQSFAEAGYWAPKASFFCLIDVVPNDNALFGQEDRQKEKLHNLVDWGYEIGSNTLNNVDLAQASSDEVARQLALSLYTLEDFLDKEYTVSSLSLPYGHYPQSDSVLASGDYDGTKYKYTAALGLDGTLCVSPFSTKFAPLHIPRITATADNIAAAIAQLKSHRELMFISDGDSTTVSAPADFDSSLGRVRDDLGRPVVLY